MRHNWWRGIHRGGEVSLSSGLGDPTPTYTASLAHVPIFVPPVFRFTCRPSGGKCCRIGGAVSIVGARSPCPAGWGTQPLRIQLRLLTFQFSCLPYSGSPVAPLGVNAAELGARYPLWGRGLLVQRVGGPNPYVYNFGCSRSNFHASRILVRHVAPLGLWLFGVCRVL